ncbi:MAG TPA: L-lactate permease [Granulicella sp.]
MWSQSYQLFGLNLGLSALIAAVPIIALLVLLGVLRKPAWLAGLAGLAITFVLAIGGYGMPVKLAISSAANGAAFGLFPISWIVFWAIALFRITQETGKFEIIKDSVGRLTEDQRLQALLIAFGFGAFVEGAAGFGTPVAIAASMLAGLGFSPFRAAAICLLANTAPVAFGSIGIPVITLAGITNLPLDKLSAFVGRLCAPISLIIPMYLVLAVGGPVALRGSLVPALAAGISFAGTQFFISNFIGPQLTDIGASLVAMATLIVVSRVWKPSKNDAYRNTATEAAVERHPSPYTPGQIAYAWSPYVLLVICVLLWGYKPFQAVLDQFTTSLEWPALHDLILRMPPVTKAPSPYHAIYSIAWFSASGTSCMVATILSAIVLRVSFVRFLRMIVDTGRQLFLPILTVATVLAMAFLLNYCGATSTYGIAFAETGTLFPFFSAILGWIGVFLTGSDTSANALFGNLQVVTANRLGLSPELMAATNSVGGVMGKMISLQTISIAAAATGMSTEDQSKLFRFTLKHSTLLACLVGILAMLYAYVFHF